ncbi:MAG: hypothetical protein QF664_04885, partial [Dehalococcoidia bacterium]|nr:hypothetical protein [Dehalococcoidia bacterium]
MADERNFWTGRRISRRAALRGVGLGIAGLVGAALIGCGDDGDDTTDAPAGPPPPSLASAATVTAAPRPEVRAGGVYRSATDVEAP